MAVQKSRTTTVASRITISEGSEVCHALNPEPSFATQSKVSQFKELSQTLAELS